MTEKEANGQSLLSKNAAMVLNEILAALNRLSAEGGEEYTIFIDKMGLDADERQTIRDFLGVGGVRISYEATSQPAQWVESAISGVWLGVFYNQNQNPIMETIEICRFPRVAAAQEADIKAGCALLAEKLGKMGIS